MTVHKSVLLEETIDNLNIKKGDTVVDATLGGGGHSLEILRRILPEGKLIAIDRDKNAIENFQKKSEDLRSKPKKENVTLVFDNFANLKKVLSDLKINSVQAVIADLGISSDQLDEAERGFSFMSDSNLDMRMDRNQSLSARVIVNTYRKEDLTKIFSEYGDEKYAHRIAAVISEERKKKIINTTKELVSVIGKAVPESYKHHRIHFATRVFQALRIETNDELESLKKFVPDAIDSLKKGGRLAIVTFHSGEDRIVKSIFRENARGCICPKEFPICRCGRKPKIKIINKKPILPSLEELESNPKSAKRKIENIGKIINSPC